MSSHRGLEGARGDLVERREKMDSKYSKELEQSLQGWIESTTGMKIGANFQAGLKNGVILCALMNKLQPNVCPKVNTTSTLAFKEMENVGSFIAACSEYGVKREDLFQTTDLYEAVNMTTVLATLDSVRRIQAIKAAGGTVVIDKPKESLLIPTKALQHKPVVAPPMGQRPIDKLYDHSKGDIVMPDTKPEASGRAGENTFGDLSERRAKIEAKYDKSLETGVRSWIEEKTGEKIGDDFQGGLKSGVILCKLMNAIKPGSVKSINGQSTMAFKQMENISNFISAAAAYGLPSFSSFQPADLYEACNMTQVLLSLGELRRLSTK